MSRTPGYMALITSENARELGDITGHKLHVKDIKQVIVDREEMVEVRKVLAAAYARVEDAHKEAWREVVNDLADAFSAIQSGDLEILQIRQNKYNAKMHEDMKKYISLRVNACFKQLDAPFKEFTDALKAVGATTQVTKLQYAHTLESYIADIVYEVASTLGYDPTKTGTGNDDSARDYHMFAARAIVDTILEDDAILHSTARAAAHKTHRGLGWDKYEGEVRKAIDELKGRIYASAEENKHWGLAPLINIKEVTKPLSQVPLWDRIQAVKQRTLEIYDQPKQEITRASKPKRTNAKGGLSSRLASTIRGSAPTGEFDEETKYE